jgi:hypothetical protein
MIHVIEMASCGVIHGPSFMKTGTGIPAILSSSLNNLRGCNIGNTDWSVLSCTPFRWAQVE